MKKNSLYIILIVLFLFCFIPKTDALLCTKRKMSDLKLKAYEVEANYELKFDEEHNYYYSITVSNVDPNLLVEFNGSFYQPEDGVVKIPDRIIGGLTYEVNLYGGYGTACVEEYLDEKKLQIPKYNVYSERDECIEYEEFYLCNKWYQGNITTNEMFEVELEEYIKSLKVEEKEEEKEKEKDTFENIIDFYVNHKEITVPITIIIVMFIGYKVVIKIIRRKNRIKLNG